MERYIKILNPKGNIPQIIEVQDLVQINWETKGDFSSKVYNFKAIGIIPKSNDINGVYVECIYFFPHTGALSFNYTKQRMKEANLQMGEYETHGFDFQYWDVYEINWDELTILKQKRCKGDHENKNIFWSKQDALKKVYEYHNNILKQCLEEIGKDDENDVYLFNPRKG